MAVNNCDDEDANTCTDQGNGRLQAYSAYQQEDD